MDKKFQVFISSTYMDLIEERKKVLEILLMADCIPAGMEAFVATDDDQFNVIKKVIDLCDYYILVIGKRYGSINEATSLSYTEMEYLYAKSKGIPVLVFVIDDAVILDTDKIETDVDKQEKLRLFKSKAMSNRLASIWKDIGDLAGKVAISIMTAKQEIDRPGWIRGNNAKEIELLNQINDLQYQNELLKEQLKSSSYKSNLKDEDFQGLAFFGYKIKLNYTEKVYVFTSDTVINHTVVETTLDEVFKFISLRLTGMKTIKDFINAVDDFKEGYYIDQQQALELKNQYIMIGLIDSTIDEDKQELLFLTEKGKKIMEEMNAMKVAKA